MNKWSLTSEAALLTAHPQLRVLFDEVLQHFDCSVLVGYRGKDDQNRAYAEGKSKLQWPKSKHNMSPSRAVDVVPFPVDWNDKQRFILFAGFVLGVASQIGVDVRWGGDWNRDTMGIDWDLAHFELV